MFTFNTMCFTVLSMELVGTLFSTTLTTSSALPSKVVGILSILGLLLRLGSGLESGTTGVEFESGTTGAGFESGTTGVAIVIFPILLRVADLHNIQNSLQIQVTLDTGAVRCAEVAKYFSTNTTVMTPTKYVKASFAQHTHRGCVVRLPR